MCTQQYSQSQHMTRRTTRVNAETEYTVDDQDGKIRWGIHVLANGQPVLSINAGDVFSTASVGKIFLLSALAKALRTGEVQPGQPLGRTGEDQVGDSGIWQFMAEDQLSIETLAVLIAAVSDNLATNVVLRHMGVAPCDAISNQAGIPRTRLLDRIRDNRGPEDPPRPSQGRAEDLARFMEMIAMRHVVDEPVSAQIEHWLSINADLSMAASALRLDPIAHADGMAGTRLFNKTGTDAGVRADTGCFEKAGTRISYAVLANWTPGEVSDSVVMDEIAQIGERILTYA